MPNSDQHSVAESTYDFASGLQPASSSFSSDGPRPAKRRRLSTPQEQKNEQKNEHENEPDDSSLKSFISHDSGGTDALLAHDGPGPTPTPRRRRSRDADSANDERDRENSANDDRSRASKRKVYEPIHRTVQDPVFVTQLTQPPSSPSRIRVPRWQKPPSSLVTPAGKDHGHGHGHGQQRNVSPYSDDNDNDNDNDNDDPDMRAAIAASLQSFQEEEEEEEEASGIQNNDPSRRDTPSPLEYDPPSGHATTTADTSFLDDIPDNAFDTSPDSSPRKKPANPMPPPPPHLSNSQQNKRQTTLMGGFAQKSNSSSSQSASYSWPLASQGHAEPPTHHRLDPEALDCWVYPANLGERRDYQFNIAQRGLFHNLLVALPTGLGKTFIAATIMLNWYRWTIASQIVFVAPTKPLVSQQVDACFGIVGIPRSQTTMLTGEAPPAVRQEEWQSKRVFFMTPQTLINDLKSGIADPKKVVLLVIDEAHRATGSYAYTQVVQFLQRFNTSFRILALTATPGSTVESVQEVIDNLNISRVEIRTETSLDIREYVHSRDVEIQTFDNSEEMAMVMQPFAKALQPVVDELRNLNAYWARDPMNLTPYGLTVARRQWMGSAAAKNASWGLKGKVNTIFTVLASLAHSVELLKYHGIGPFFRGLLSFQDPGGGGSNGKAARQIRDDENFKNMMDRLRMWTNKDEFVGHPKLEYLKQAVLNHFLDAEDSNNNNNNTQQTRIMIFAHFRDSAEEIVRVLRRHEPIVKPHVFVGQANTKGSDGMDQKTQLQIVQKFKTGVYNTLVATSVGEEGLDIGEVDLIVCYDSSASPIRMLQRMGRTGRKRQGNIVLLLMKGKEEDSYTKAKDNYEKMQDLIASGARFRYHTDKSPRIIPREIQPVPEEKKIEIPVENSQPDLPEPPRRPGRKPKRPPKKFHMPDDVETGFTTASRVGRPKQTPKQTAASHDSDEDRIADGSDSDAHGSISISMSNDEHAPVPRPHEISITSSQKADLTEEFRTNTSSADPLRVDAFPSAQRRLRPTRFVRHGRSTRGMVTTLRQMAEMGSDCEETCRKHFRADDVERFMSSPDNKSPLNHESGGGEGEGDDEDNVVLSDGLSSFSSLMCSPRRPKRAHVDNDDDSDIPDPSTLFDRLLSANKRPLSPPQEQEEGERLEDGEHSTPQPSAPRRNNTFVISSDDSDT